MYHKVVGWMDIYPEDGNHHNNTRHTSGILFKCTYLEPRSVISSRSLCKRLRVRVPSKKRSPDRRRTVQYSAAPSGARLFDP